MKKVVYSVTRYRKDDIDKISGLGYITDTDLVIACIHNPKAITAGSAKLTNVLPHI